MGAIKINEFWIPENDIHLNDWKAGQPFTQNKCLNKFIEWCDQHGKKFNTVLDIGAWCGTWTQVMEPYANKIIAFEPDKLHFDCLNKNCKNSINKQVAVGNTIWTKVYQDAAAEAEDRLPFSIPIEITK